MDIKNNNNEKQILSIERRKSDLNSKLIHSAESYTIQWKNGFKFILVRDDLLKQDTNAIVNAANKDLWLGGGVAGGIRMEGGDLVKEECEIIIKERGKPLEVGEVVPTGKGDMKNENLKYIFHAVGPCYRGGKFGEDVQLYNAFNNCFLLSEQMKVSSISLPPISSGKFLYPKEEVAQIFYKVLDNYVLENLSGKGCLKEIRMVIIDFPTYFVFTEEHNKILKVFKERYRGTLELVEPDFTSIIDNVVKAKLDEEGDIISERINTLKKEFEEETYKKTEENK